MLFTPTYALSAIMSLKSTELPLRRFREISQSYNRWNYGTENLSKESNEKPFVLS